MPGEFHIVAPCPACGHEATLTHPIADGEVLTTPPVAFVQCQNPRCNKPFKVTIRIDCELVSKARKSGEFGPMRITPG